MHLVKGDLFRLGFSALDEVVVWAVEVLECPTGGPTAVDVTIISSYIFIVIHRHHPHNNHFAAIESFVANIF